MDKKIIEKIKEELLISRKQISAELDEVADKGDLRAKFPNLGDKPDENVQEIDQYTTNLATEKVLKNALRDIDGTLERIERGVYGICKYCGKGIDERRLLARPVASACMECKNKLQSSK